MRYNQLGDTGIKISEISFGTWPIGGHEWGPIDDGESIEGIRRAADIGINFFDTANVYGDGHSESILATALEGRRDKVYITTKGGMLPGRKASDFSPAALEQSLHGSLKRLKADYVDLFQLHNPDLAVMKRGDAIEACERFMKSGKIRSWGVSLRPPSNHWKTLPTGASDDPVAEGLELLTFAKPTSLQLVFNIFQRSAADKLFALAKSKKISIFARVPLESGLLSGKFNKDTAFPDDDFRSKWPRKDFLEDIKRVDSLKEIFKGSAATLAQGALAFTLSFDAVTTTIVGAKTARQIEENAAASQHAPLSPALLSRIQSISA
jgi:myo-inositol catabolism protein IolS